MLAEAHCISYLDLLSLVLVRHHPTAPDMDAVQLPTVFGASPDSPPCQATQLTAAQAPRADLMSVWTASRNARSAAWLSSIRQS
jgi:hypothetical protein